jgi:hypothetical protein
MPCSRTLRLCGDPFLQGVARRLSSAQQAQRLNDRLQIHADASGFEIYVEPFLHGTDSGLHLASGGGQRQRDLSSIVRCDTPLNEAGTDQPIDQPARVAAAFAHQKRAEPG